MKARATSLGRSAAILASFAVAGAVGGYAWERATFEEPAAEPLARVSEAVVGALPQRPSGSSPVEQATVRRATRGLPPYKSAVPQSLAADYLGPKVPIAVAWFATEDSAEQVLGFYKAAFLEAGLPVVEKKYGPSSGFVGYLDPKNDEVHLVSAMGKGKQTMVFPSSGQMGGFLDGDAEVPEVLPHPKESLGTTVLKFSQEGVFQYSVVTRVPGTSILSVLGFYKEGFEAKGWTLERESKVSPNEVQLDLTLGPSRATTLIRGTLVSEDIQVYVTLTSRG